MTTWRPLARPGLLELAIFEADMARCLSESQREPDVVNAIYPKRQPQHKKATARRGPDLGGVVTFIAEKPYITRPTGVGPHAE